MDDIKLAWDELTSVTKERLTKDYSIEALHKAYPEKSIAFFEKEKKIINLKPRFKDDNAVDEKDIENYPSLEIIKNRSLLISPEMALIEFLDNIFDNYIKNLKAGTLDHPLKIEIIFYDVNNQSTLLIRENSGGIHPNDIIPLVKPGESGNNKSNDMIGTRGEAFLYSCYSLGSDVTVYSYHKEGKPFSIPIDQNFFNSEKWVLKEKVSKEFDGIKNLDKGWTVFEIKNVYKYTTNDITLYEELKAEIEDTYWKKASEIYDLGHNVSIKINPFFSKELEVQFDFFEINNSFSHYPYCLPIFVQDYELIFNDEHGKKCSILVNAYCGINPFGKDHNYAKFKGVCMWGNGRLFERNRRDTSVGYNVSSTGIRLEQRSLFNHLSILLFFKSKKREWNKYIPWKIPTKKGFNSESVLKKKILDFIIILVERFIFPLDHLLGGNRFIFEIFSYDFIERSEDEKFEYLLNEIGQSRNRIELYPDIDPKKWKNLSKADKEELRNILIPFFILKNEHIHDLEKYEGDVAGIENLQSRNKEFNEAIKAFSNLLGKSKDEPGYLKKMVEHFLETGFLPTIDEEIEEEEEKEEKKNMEVIQSKVKDILIKEQVNNEKVDEHFDHKQALKKEKKDEKEIENNKERKLKQEKPLSIKAVSIKRTPIEGSNFTNQPKKSIKTSKNDISSKLQKSVKRSKKDLRQIREQKETVSIKLELEKDNVRKLKKKLDLSPNTSAKATIFVLISTFLEDSN